MMGRDESTDGGIVCLKVVERCCLKALLESRGSVDDRQKAGPPEPFKRSCLPWRTVD